MVESLERRDWDRHGLDSEPTCGILLCLWERHFTVLFPAWWSWQTVLNFNHISIKLESKTKNFQMDSNILVYLKQVGVICLPYV